MTRKDIVRIVTLLVMIVSPLAGRASDGQPAPTQSVAAKDYDARIRPLLAKHCLACHGPDKTKGNLRLDRLAPDFADAASRGHWQDVGKRLQASEMPPKGKPQPAASEVRVLTEWIAGNVQAAEAVRRAQGRVVLRRLNRVEYENTIGDLLGIKIDVQDLLPVDSAAGGFDNVGEALHTSSFLMERYLEAADKALGMAIANGPRPPLIKKRYSLKNQHGVKNPSEKVFRKLDDDTVVLFASSPWQAVHLYEFYPPDRGVYRFRMSTASFQSPGKAVTYRLDAGLMGMVGKNHLVGFYDVQEKPNVLEWTEYLEARSTIRMLPYGLAGAQIVDKIGADKYDGPGLAVHWIDVEGPLHDTWPPASHRRIFGDLAQGTVPAFDNRNRLEVVSKDPEADAERILRGFARRAFRRTVTDDDVKPFLEIVKTKLAAKYTFEQAVRVGLLGILVSPKFLFLRETASPASAGAGSKSAGAGAKSAGAGSPDPAPPPAPRKSPLLDDFALASRLSYFLWSTMPDEELLTLAEAKKLSQPATLRQQVERLLRDPKAQAFTENFVGQWLGLREIDATIPSHILHPEYDEMLKYSMLKETYLFWDEVLKNDLSLASFVDADFAMLNGRLAKHYGLPAPASDTWTFRKVPLPPDSHRGGVLTMASVLKVTANGTYTSPVLRGAWVLERILGTPPPRPPEGIAAVEPDIRGATTIREQLAKHRSVASCASCHKKIDPPGFALESFDVIGGWREHYRTSGNGKPVTVDGRRMPYHEGRKVDPADTLADGRGFRDIDEFKKLLLEDRDQLARALASRLVTYATGATVDSRDHAEIDQLVAAIRPRNYGLRTLVHEIAQSELFRRK